MEDVIKACKEITTHADFLRDVGLSLTFSCISPVFAPVMPELLKYEAHLPPVCVYLKAHKGIPGRCIMNKARLSAKKITEPYYSSCWAGVEEFVIPVNVDGVRALLINVSGYRSTLKKSELKRAELSQGLAERTFDELYATLSPTPPTISYVLSAVTPLSYLIRNLYLRCLSLKKNVDDDLYVKMLDYVHENYTGDCSIKSIASALAYSESYLRHLFRAKSGTSIGQYVIDLRLSHARDLMAGTSLSVADVASACGFDDPNYLSSAFKRRFDTSPIAYRKSKKSD